MSKMLQGGEDPLFIARRLVILASEDIGNAEPRALPLAISAMQAVDFVGMPEAAICLAQAVTFLASSPKSNRSYMALKKAQAAVESRPQLTPPMNIVNGVTKLMKSLGYGASYKYDHDEKSGISQQSFMPEELKGVKFYEPIEKGHEKNLKAYLDWVQTFRNNTEK
jgi:putative ATPase